MKDDPKEQFGIVREIFIKHFVQIIMGCLLYFYYVGYVLSIVSFKDSFYQMFWLIETPNSKGIVFLGVAGFLVFNCLMFFYLVIYNILKGIYAALKKYNVKKSELYFWSVVVFISECLLFMKNGLFIWVLLFVVVGITFNISQPLKKYSSLLIFKYIEGIFICFYLLIFPFIVIQSSMIGAEINLDHPGNTYNSLNVTTNMPLGIEGEQKSSLGYVNKLQLLNIKNNLFYFFEPKLRRLIVIKSEDMIRIVRDPYPYREPISFDIGGFK